MKILVTGGAGFIGSNVVDGLIDAGHEVLIVDNLSSGKGENVNPRATFYELDITGPEVVELIQRERPDIVNHHAAQVSVRDSVANPVEDCRLNVLGTLNLIEASHQAGIGKFIYISSGGAVYGEPTKLPCDEGHQIRPDSPYGASKHAAEHYLDIYQRVHGLPYTVLRYGNVYGPRQDPHGEAGVVAIFTDRMLHGQPVTINGSGEQERDFVYVGDVVRANLAALERGENSTYNIGNGVGTTVNEIFTAISQATDSTLPAVYGPAKVGETFRIYLDISKAAEELDWTPQVPLQEGLQLTVDALR